MLIHLSEVLTSEDRVCGYTVPVEFDSFDYHGNVCPVLEKPDMVLTLVNKGDQKIDLHLKGGMKLGLPCDRCLEETAVDIDFDVQTGINMKETGSSDELSEEELEAEQERLEDQTLVDGYKLDTDQLIIQELMLRVPAKVLCKEDCKGICYQCGKNLNYGSCDCREEPKDPRMAAILDLFNESGKQS